MINDWRSFKGIHAGQSCVVICNGKSLADVKRRFHAPLMERMELAYRRATQVYTLYDRELYNATPDTQLPDYIMPRCDLDEVYR